MTRSEKPGLRLRKTSLTMRQRLTPAMTFSTRTREPARSWLSQRSETVKSLPFDFFRLEGQHSGRLIALKASVLMKGSVRRIGDSLLIGQFLVMGLAWHGGAEIQHPLAGAMNQRQVLVGMGFLLPAVSCLLDFGLTRTLAAALAASSSRFGSPSFTNGWFATALGPVRVSCPSRSAPLAAAAVGCVSSNWYAVGSSQIAAPASFAAGRSSHTP
jgi:hypothetical protein